MNKPSLFEHKEKSFFN